MAEYRTKEQQTAFYLSNEWRGVNGARQKALQRANHECEWCKLEGKVTTTEHAVLEVDHIYELADYPKLALVQDNLRVLCKRHHNQRHKRFEFGKKENKWADDELDIL